MAEKTALAMRPVIQWLRDLDWSSPRQQIAVPATLLLISLSPTIIFRPTGADGVWMGVLILLGVLAMILTDIYPTAATLILSTIGAGLSLLTCMLAVQHGWQRPTFINPNWLASWLILTLPFSTNWVITLLGVLALVITGSRGAWLAFTSATVALILWSYHRAGTLRARWLVLAVLTVAAATLLAVAMRPATVLDRLATWRVACELWLQSPFIGRGLGASMTLLRDNHADSLLMTVLLELGALGLLALCWLGVAIARLCFGPRGTPARLALLAFMLHQVVDATLYLPGTALLAGAALALLVRHNEQSTSGDHAAV